MTGQSSSEAINILLKTRGNLGGTVELSLLLFSLQNYLSVESAATMDIEAASRRFPSLSSSFGVGRDKKEDKNNTHIYI